MVIDMEYIEVSAKTVSEAITEACRQLGDQQQTGCDEKAWGYQ